MQKQYQQLWLMQNQMVSMIETLEMDGHGLDDKDKLGVLRGFSGLCNSFLRIGLDSALQYLQNNFGLFCNYLPII